MKQVFIIFILFHNSQMGLLNTNPCWRSDFWGMKGDWVLTKIVTWKLKILT